MYIDQGYAGSDFLKSRIPDNPAPHSLAGYWGKFSGYSATGKTGYVQNPLSGMSLIEMLSIVHVAGVSNAAFF